MLWYEKQAKRRGTSRFPRASESVVRISRNFLPIFRKAPRTDLCSNVLTARNVNKLYRNLEEFIAGWQENTAYFEMLQLVSSLSKLFSESSTPYLEYRVAEN